jgi:hypothetical protein
VTKGAVAALYHASKLIIGGVTRRTLYAAPAEGTPDKCHTFPRKLLQRYGDNIEISGGTTGCSLFKGKDYLAPAAEMILR